jgi:hypothetical protein
MQEALAAWKRYVYFVSFSNKIFLVVSKTEVLLTGTMSTSLSFFENPREEMYLPFVCGQLHLFITQFLKLRKPLLLQRRGL